MCTKALLFAALAAALSTGAQAGQYADAMAQCILSNTSASDRDTLTQWAYVTLGKTDAAKKVQAIPAAKTKAVEDKAKKLVTNLTTQDRASEHGCGARAGTSHGRNQIEDAQPAANS